MKLTEKASEALQQVLDCFERGDIPEAIVRTVLPTCGVPCSHWSLNNRILTFLANTEDARGIRQWNEAGRGIIPGRKAFYILVPLHVKVRRDEEEDGRQRLLGFKAMPVFRIEDTDGEPVVANPLPPINPPPLLEVAEHWGISVRYTGFTNGMFGAYSPSRKTIVLATHDEDTFLHELAHVAHEKVLGKLEIRQDWRQEIVAELTAATLLRLYGRVPQEGRAYQYIRRYAEDAGYDPHRACLQVIREVEQCLWLILGVAKPEKVEADEVA